ncbi:MAG TPA: hypothetical protein DEQ34_14455 [Balneolaceae bacterium]|nr:hypothetical protein [Balneolaceae bacterium]|tara:strand:+ start:13389 stop:14075 length:687 start_codon:yes stop_codon:yes gene_type:complete
MKITPLEIKQQQFEKSLRGYDVADVQAFLTLVSTEFEYLITKNKELEDQIDKLSDRVKHYERVEEALHETLQTTKESVAQKMDNARSEAKNTVTKAQMDAEAIVQEANQERMKIRQSILRLLDKREEIIAGITSYLDNAKAQVDKFSRDDMKIFDVPEEATTDSSVSDMEETEVTDEKKKEPTETAASSRFAFDDESLETESDDIIDEDDSAFPPGTDRLNDILDEID